MSNQQTNPDDEDNVHEGATVEVIELNRDQTEEGFT